MFALVRHPVEVTVQSGGTSTWLVLGAALIALLGSVIVAATAYVAARLAAKTANERQQEQLTADFNRLEAQLAHERVLRTRDHVRDAIDAAVEGVDEMVKALASLNATVVNNEQARRVARAEIADEAAPDEKRQEARQLVMEEMTQLHDLSMPIFDLLGAIVSQGLRLQLRLRDHRVVETQKALRLALEDRHDLLNPAVSRSLTDEELTTLEEEQDPVGVALNNFLSACEGWLAEEEELHPTDQSHPGRPDLDPRDSHGETDASVSLGG